MCSGRFWGEWPFPVAREHPGEHATLKMQRLQGTEAQQLSVGSGPPPLQRESDALTLRWGSFSQCFQWCSRPAGGEWGLRQKQEATKKHPGRERSRAAAVATHLGALCRGQRLRLPVPCNLRAPLEARHRPSSSAPRCPTNDRPGGRVVPLEEGVAQGARGDAHGRSAPQRGHHDERARVGRSSGAGVACQRDGSDLVGHHPRCSGIQLHPCTKVGCAEEMAQSKCDDVCHFLLQRGRSSSKSTHFARNGSSFAARCACARRPACIGWASRKPKEATECCDEDQGDEPLQTASLVCEAGWNCLERAPTGGTFQP
mmetsp:Transcript_39400/g.75490  ORF Transcript_39400/g.75490 Transcript_39400/m.75490 type:complete len:314 (+) Transcript_39400:196-1137(+)